MGGFSDDRQLSQKLTHQLLSKYTAFSPTRMKSAPPVPCVNQSSSVQNLGVPPCLEPRARLSRDSCRRSEGHRVQFSGAHGCDFPSNSSRQGPEWSALDRVQTEPPCGRNVHFNLPNSETPVMPLFCLLKQRA